MAAYGDLEMTDPEDAWTLGGASRVENFEDFGTTTNGKVSGRFGLVRGSVSSGFRAPTPGQQNGFNISSWFEPTVGDRFRRPPGSGQVWILTPPRARRALRAGRRCRGCSTADP